MLQNNTKKIFFRLLVKYVDFVLSNFCEQNGYLEGIYIKTHSQKINLEFWSVFFFSLFRQT